MPVLAAAPTCTATVQSLPDAGAGMSPWWIAAALAMIVAGAAVLLLARRSRLIAALVGIGLLGLVLTTPSPPPAAAANEIGYAEGCTLIAIDAESVTWTAPARATGLLPGDTAPVLTLTLTNTYAEPVRLSGRLRVAPALAEDLAGRVRFDDAPGPTWLAPGQRIEVTLDIGLTPTADDDLQGRETPLELVLTATAR